MKKILKAIRVVWRNITIKENSALVPWEINDRRDVFVLEKPESIEGMLQLIHITPKNEASRWLLSSIGVGEWIFSFVCNNKEYDLVYNKAYEEIPEFKNIIHNV